MVGLRSWSAPGFAGKDAQDGPGTCHSSQSVGGGPLSAAGREGARDFAADGSQVSRGGRPRAEGDPGPAAAGLGRRAGPGGRAAGRIGPMDRWEAAADGHAAARAAGRRGPSGRRHARQGGRRRVEAPAPRGLRAADVSAGRSRRGRLLRGAGRSRRASVGRRGSF